MKRPAGRFLYDLSCIMTNPQFPKFLHYDALKAEYSEEESTSSQKQISASDATDHTATDEHALRFDQPNEPKQPPPLTGTRLRSYAFAVLTRREYSKADLIEKLALYAPDYDEVVTLVEELARENYQSDQRVAEMMLASQKRKGKGPNRIKMALKSKKLDSALVQDELKETNWLEQAYQLKVRKYGVDVAQDVKLKAKQIRFLQYRGFEMDVIMKAIKMTGYDDFD